MKIIETYCFGFSHDGHAEHREKIHNMISSKTHALFANTLEIVEKGFPSLFGEMSVNALNLFALCLGKIFGCK